MIALIAQLAGNDLKRISKEQASEFLRYSDTNIVHPLALVIFLAAAAWLFLGPRGKMSWSLLTIACLISTAQRFAIVTLDFGFIRAIGTLALIRILTYGELRSIRPHYADKAMLGYIVATILFTVIREGVGGATQTAGFGLACFSVYWIGRSSIRSGYDLRMMMVAIGVLAIPVSIFMTIEQVTGRNTFSIFGGISEFTAIRDGKLRSQGSFCHPIIAGVFYASFAPLAIGVVLSKSKGMMALLSGWVCLALCVVIILATNSSTPIAGLLLGVVAWCAFKFRRNLKIFLYIVILLMIVGHFTSTLGIHHVIFNKIDFTGSSTGMHRYFLIDGMINNLSQWMIVGDTSHGYNKAFRDITNMYVMAGLTGGLVALTLLIILVVAAFKGCTKAVRNAGNRQDRMISYGLGCALFVMCVSYTAVHCYGEGVVPFFMLIGAAISIGQAPPGTNQFREVAPSPEPYRQKPPVNRPEAQPART